MARLVQECRLPELATVRAAVEGGTVSVGVGLGVVSEFQALRPMLRDEARPTVLDGLVKPDTDAAFAESLAPAVAAWIAELS